MTMRGRFEYFVVLAGMRTGSNFLEANLEALDGVSCHGEAFNPHFIGHKGRTEMFGQSLRDREEDPFALLAAIRESDTMAGFRLFHDHDPRILVHCLEDRRCAKIILARNPLDSYVSLKIAAATGQWKLTNARNRKTARPRFDAAEFEAHLHATRAFHDRLRRALQRSGQTAFHIAYEDLADVAVLNGLAQFLGVPARLSAPSRALARQNPEPVTDKVANPEEMVHALSEIDRFEIDAAAPEPERSPAVRHHLVIDAPARIFVPLPGGPTAALRDWLAALGGPPRDGLTQKQMRQFKRRHPGHRSFTVLRHPVARLWSALTRLATDADGAQRRAALNARCDLALPEPDAFAALDPAQRHALMLDFVALVGRSLGGDGWPRPEPDWASQGAVLQGVARFAPPDHVLREDSLATELPILGAAPPPAPEPMPALAAFHDDAIEAAVRKVHARDYAAFGFGDWRA